MTRGLVPPPQLPHLTFNRFMRSSARQWHDYPTCSVGNAVSLLRLLIRERWAASPLSALRPYAWKYSGSGAGDIRGGRDRFLALCSREPHGPLCSSEVTPAMGVLLALHRVVLALFLTLLMASRARAYLSRAGRSTSLFAVAPEID